VKPPACRRQLIVLERQVPGRVLLTNSDRLFFLKLYRWFPSIVEAVTTCACRKSDSTILVMKAAEDRL
jgi:hypothetical protein